MDTDYQPETPTIHFTLQEKLDGSVSFSGQLTFIAEALVGMRSRNEIEEQLVLQMKEWIVEREQSKYEVMP